MKSKGRSIDDCGPCQRARKSQMCSKTQCVLISFRSWFLKTTPETCLYRHRFKTSCNLSLQTWRQLVKSSRHYRGVLWRAPEPSEVPPGGKFLGGKTGEPLYSKCDPKGVCRGHPSAPGGSPGPLGSARQEDPLEDPLDLWGASVGGIPRLPGGPWSITRVKEIDDCHFLRIMQHYRSWLKNHYRLLSCFITIEGRSHAWLFLILPNILRFNC